MAMTLNVLVDPGDIQKFTTFMESMDRRMARSELLPIMKGEFEPIVEAERGVLEGHSKSGALLQSLKVRSGAGDRPGTISVFSTPSGTVKQLRRTWGRGRRQQQGWAAALEGRGRRRVFYALPLHQGHRVVVRNAAGELVDTGRFVDPIPFAQQAVDSLGESVAESMAEAILKHITQE
jgi:hypothetical protein